MAQWGELAVACGLFVEGSGEKMEKESGKVRSRSMSSWYLLADGCPGNFTLNCLKRQNAMLRSENLIKAAKDSFSSSGNFLSRSYDAAISWKTSTFKWVEFGW